MLFFFLLTIALPFEQALITHLIEDSVIQIGAKSLAGITAFLLIQAIATTRWAASISKAVNGVRADLKQMEALHDEKYNRVTVDVMDHEQRLRDIERGQFS